MGAQYTSIVYDLTKFGIFRVKNAVFTADMDLGIIPTVSFDGGRSFFTPVLNERFAVSGARGKIQVRLSFPTPNSNDVYTIRTSGYFVQLAAGTKLFFEDQKTRETFNTAIGAAGKYTISLPPAVYDVYYVNQTMRETLIQGFNPEFAVTDFGPRLDKEAIIEGFMKDLSWSRYATFDTFESVNKMLETSTTQINQDGNLGDGESTLTVGYWAIVFDV